MNRRITSMGLIVSALVLSTSVYAADAAPKQTLKSNYQRIYNQTQGTVDNFADMFKKGEFYGALRSNTFYYQFEDESAGDSHVVSGLGGSLVYKSATFADFDFTAGLYYSKSYFDGSKDQPSKASGDTLNLYNYGKTGDTSMGVLGQANLRYTGIAKTELILGRQLVETFYTKSNDTKMIPNTFDGLVATTKIIDKTAIKFAYLAKEKLRGREEAHSVLMYDSSSSDGNNDSAMHKGLTKTALRAAGVSTDAPLITGDIHNKSVKNLKLDASFYAVPELLSEIMLEANYKISLGDFTVSPGMRYIKQFDNGAGAIGGAAYDTKTAGYNDIDSLDAQMIAARVVAKISNYKFNLGYSNILDEADLITPWRAFPTSGYTRSMARYNWRANTKGYRIEMQRNATKTGMYKDLFIQASILYTDADEDKNDYDAMYYYIGFVQNIPSLENMQVRLRLGYEDTEKDDSDNLDSRFEINYLF
ncbi:MAG: hypothetical protein ACJAWW_000239 [Sulfurimonas sp.]